MKNRVNRECSECGQGMTYGGRHVECSQRNVGPHGECTWGWWCHDLKCKFGGCVIEPRPFTLQSAGDPTPAPSKGKGVGILDSARGGE